MDESKSSADNYDFTGSNFQGATIYIKSNTNRDTETPHQSSITKDFILSNIKQLLREGFNEQELRNDLPLEVQEFNLAFDYIASNANKAELTHELIEWALKKRLMGLLLKWAQEHNLGAYEEFQPYWHQKDTKRRKKMTQNTSGASTGDIFNMSGFTGAIVNIKSTLTNVNQQINTSTVESSIQQELNHLVDELSQALEKIPADKEEEAEAVAKSAEALINAATEKKPNKTMVEISSEGLKKAAKNIADVMPIVLTIATQIIATVAKIVN
jgi:hypothetical protein